MNAEEGRRSESTKDSGDLWAGPEAASFLAAVRPWQASVSRILSRILGNTHDAEDAWQNLVLRWWQSPGKLPAPEKFAVWARRCAVNEAIRVLRRRKIRNHSTIDQVQSQQAEPCDAITAEELQIKVAAALQSLVPEDRALLTLRFDEGLTIREIAEVVEHPPATVHFRLEKAIAVLRKILGTPLLEQRKS